jgi:hypothetical protein
MSIAYLIDLSKREKNFATKNMTARKARLCQLVIADDSVILRAVVTSKKEAQLNVGNMDRGGRSLAWTRTLSVVHKGKRDPLNSASVERLAAPRCCTAYIG